VVKPEDELRGNAACAIFSGIDRLPLAAVLSWRQWISTGRSGKTAVRGILGCKVVGLKPTGEERDGLIPWLL
jgi:hypothetical protein